MADKETKSAGDATSKPSYGEKGQPQPTGVNRTDAEGIDSNTQIGAATGEPADVAAARMKVEAYDKTKEQFAGKDGHLPHILKSNLDVRRGDQVFRIPAGAVITDTDLTDEEWDHVLALRIAGEASVSQMQQHEARLQAEESDQAARDLRREQAGVAPKKARGEKAPKGSTLVTDLNMEAAAGARLAAAREVALTGTPARGAAPAVAGEKK
jgi:hypothetical protein